MSESEAEAYQRRYLELLAALADNVADWPDNDQVDRAPWGKAPRANISVKLSALYSQLDPIAPERSTERVIDRLRPILRSAKEHGAHVQFDMEDYHLKDLTLHIFRRIGDDPEFKAYRHLGIALQAYLRETEKDALDLIHWARRRGTPVKVRLVKGAYWDYETVGARLHNWPVPVYENKWESDAAFERLTERFLESRDCIDVATGSHNVRSIAHAMAMAEAMDLPQDALEFQFLYGMATPLRQAMVDMGRRVRVYAPYGELIPGMAYLVRRLLENTSNESFLRQGFVEGKSPDLLLRDPEKGASQRNGANRDQAGGNQPAESRTDVSPETANPETANPETVNAKTVDRDKADRDTSQNGTRRQSPGQQNAFPGYGSGPEVDLPPFATEPHTDFAQADNRRLMGEAIERVRSELGGYYPLVVGETETETESEIVSVNPSQPSEVIGRTAKASADDARRAVDAALTAFPGWRDRSSRDRVEILRRAAEIMRRRRFDLAALICLENGKQWREADGDVTEAIDFIEYYARHALHLAQPIRTAGLTGEINRYIYEPRGVAAVIAPWNFPLAILTGMSAAALVSGNAVILKPAEQTPVIAAKLFEIYREAGVPAGAVNYLPGYGDAGAALVRHPEVRTIAFTGSRKVGLEIIAQAAQVHEGQRHIKRAITEMGGKNAVIVDDDADLDEAVAGIVSSAFGYSGQKCSAASRVIVVGSIYDALVERLTEAAKSLVIGPSTEPDTIVGPLIDEEAQQRVLSYIEQGEQEGEVLLRREVPDEVATTGGYYVPMAIFEVAPDAVIAREEIFGPVLSLFRVDTFAEALELANDSEYKLTGGLFSRSPAHIETARRRFRVGNLYINRGITGSLVGRQPFGGLGLSGTGFQAGGPDYLKQFMESRTITENTLRRGFADA